MDEDLREMTRVIGRLVLADRRWVFWGRIAWALAGLAVGLWALISLRASMLRFGL